MASMIVLYFHNGVYRHPGVLAQQSEVVPELLQFLRHFIHEFAWNPIALLT